MVSPSLKGSRIWKELTIVGVVEVGSDNERLPLPLSNHGIDVELISVGQSRDRWQHIPGGGLFGDKVKFQWLHLAWDGHLLIVTSGFVGHTALVILQRLDVPDGRARMVVGISSPTHAGTVFFDQLQVVRITVEGAAGSRIWDQRTWALQQRFPTRIITPGNLRLDHEWDVV